MKARRGLSELIGSLILIAIVGSLMTYIMLSSNALSHKMSEVVDDASKQLSESSGPPFMSVYLNDNELHVKIYAFRPINVKGILYQKLENITYIKINKIIIDQYDLIVDRNYSCEPVRLYLETGTGLILSYNPERDPHIMSLPDTIKARLLAKTYVDCDLLVSSWENISSDYMSASQFVKNITNIYKIYNDINYNYEVVEAMPSAVFITRGNPYTLKILKVNVSGSLALGGTLDYTITYRSNGTEITLGPFSLGPLQRGVLLTRYIATIEEDNETINVSAGAYCTYVPSVCITGLLFKDNNNIIINGESYVKLKANYHDISATCPFSKYHYIAPMVLAPLSNFTTEVDATCSSTGGIRVDLYGESRGVFSTHSGIILAVTMTPALEIKLNATIFLREVNLFIINSTSVSIDSPGFISYKLLPKKITYIDSLIEAADHFLYYNRSDNIIIHALVNNITITRQATTDTKKLPYENLSLTIVFKPDPVLPLQTITVANYEYTHTGISYRYEYSWKITSQRTLAPYPQLLPEILLIYDNSSRTAYIVVFPVGRIYVSQFGKSYYGLAKILAGLEYSIDPGCSSYVIFPLKTIDLSQGVKVHTSIYDEELTSLDTIEQPGDYLVICSKFILNKRFYYSVYVKAF